MPSLRYRSILPVGHTVVDLLLLAAWIWHATGMLKQQKGSLTVPSVVTAVALLQENGTVSFDFSRIPPPPEFVLLLSGTLPAGIVSNYLRPEAAWQTRRSLWDPIWLVIHEAVAIPFWFLMGMWIDAGRSHLGRPMQFYLLGRCVFGLLEAAFGAASLGVLLQGLFWLALAGYGIVHGVQRLAQVANRVRSQVKAPPES